MNEIARVFQALSQAPRLRILSLLLRHGELCGCDVEAALGMSQSSVSRHLRHLARAGLLEDRREGYRVLYRIVQAPDAPRRVVLEAARTLLEDRPMPDAREELMGAWREGDGASESPGVT